MKTKWAIGVADISTGKHRVQIMAPSKLGGKEVGWVDPAYAELVMLAPDMKAFIEAHLYGAYTDAQLQKMARDIVSKLNINKIAA